MSDTAPQPPPDIQVEIRGEKFRFYGDVPVMVLSDFAVAGRSEEEALRAIHSFEEYLCVPEDRDRLHKFLRSARPAIGPQELIDLFGKVIEAMTARQGAEVPTPASSPFSPGGGATPSTSPVSSPATAVVD